MKITDIAVAAVVCLGIVAIGGALAEAQTASHPVPAHPHKAAGARAYGGAVARRPHQARESLFMSDAQSEALYAPRERCLVAHGLSSKTSDRGEGPLKAVPAPDAEAAEAACAKFLPLPPWQYDSANPHSMEFIGAVVACLKARGVTEVEGYEAGPGEDQNGIALGGPGNDPSSITLGLEAMTGCEHAALSTT